MDSEFFSTLCTASNVSRSMSDGCASVKQIEQIEQIGQIDNYQIYNTCLFTIQKILLNFPIIEELYLFLYHIVYLRYFVEF